jgi:hypothetical protein
MAAGFGAAPAAATKVPVTARQQPTSGPAQTNRPDPQQVRFARGPGRMLQNVLQQWLSQGARQLTIAASRCVPGFHAGMLRSRRTRTPPAGSPRGENRLRGDSRGREPDKSSPSRLLTIMMARPEGPRVISKMGAERMRA